MLNYTRLRFLNQTNRFKCVQRQIRQNNISNSQAQKQQLSLQTKRKWTSLYGRFSIGLVLGGIFFYDGCVNDFVYSGAAVRFLRSMKTAAFIACDYMLLNEGDEEYEKQLKEVHTRSANRLLETCLINGGLYIKVGQGVAAINHILPKEYTNTLIKLQDECLHRSPNDVRKVFRRDFGKLPEEIYCDFNYVPIAAASLAQVFKAKLRTGEQVAVKVQYSDLQKRFISDLGTIIFLQNIIEFFFKSYNFGWIMKDLRANLLQELNFKKEGENAERCAADMKKFKFVHVPKVYWDFTTERVLTLEWIDGFKITDMQKIHEQKMSIKDIDRKLFEVSADQIFNTGFVHADPHSGNIFVRRSETNGKAEIVILDHGLYETVPEEVRNPLCEFWEATVLRNLELMRKTAAKLNIREYKKFAEVLFQQPIETESSGIKNKLTDEDIIHMQTVAKENFERIMDTLREMPRNLLFVVRNLNTIRAIGRHHGDVVDRPKVMARLAQHYIIDKSGHTYSKYIRYFFRRMYFEYCLWTASFKMQCINIYLNLLYFLGRAPEEARTIMRDLLTIPYEEMKS